MTVQLLRVINNYIGLSGDTKPTTDIEIGSVFTETDTSEEYKFDGTGWFVDRPRIDASTEAQMVVLYEHHEIHSGSHFLMNESFDIASGDVIDIRITTPPLVTSTKEPHLILSFDTEVEYEFWFYEVVVITNAGTAFTPINSNRNSVKASILAIDVIENSSLANANADTDVSGATTIWHGMTGAGRQQGGSASGRNELILKHDTIYGFRALAKAAGWIHGEMHWYEHTPRR